MTEPMSDDALIALAEHRFAQADRAGATHEDCRQLRDIFPAVLQRLREKVDLTRDLIASNSSPINPPRRWEQQADCADGQRDEDQMQLCLLDI